MRRRDPATLSATLLLSLAGTAHAGPGGPPGFPAAVDLSQLNGFNGVQIGGLASDDFLGASVSSAGDFNGDGIDDLIIAAPYATTENNEFIPQAYIVFGSSDSQSAAIDIDPLDGIQAIRFNAIPLPKGDGVYSDMTVASAGDINGDKISDIIIGVPYAAVGKNADTGQVFVIFGRNTAEDGAFPPEIDAADLDGTNGFVIDGLNATDRFGSSVASAGDFNADKIGDIIIGAPYVDPSSPMALGGRTNAGRTYVVFGKDTARNGNFPANFDLATLDGSNGLTIDGVDVFDRSGTSVASAGDVNGDKITDLIIGAPVASGGGGPGAAYVVFGRKPRASSPIPALFELALIDGTNGFRINGIDDGDFCGQTVSSAGDVNGDKISDIVVGAIRANDQAGEAYVVFGRKTPFTHPFNPALLNGSNGFFVRGNAADDACGFSLAPIGDFNRDKVADLAVSGRGFDTYTGATFVIFGKNVARSGPFSDSFLPGSFDGVQGMRFNGGAPGDEAGHSIASAGDFNGDGARDLLIGAPFDSAGTAYVVFGPAPEVLVSFEGVPALSTPVLEDGDTLELSGLIGGFITGNTTDLDFTINNLGLADLSVTRLRAPKGFTITKPPAATVDALGSTPFTLRITPTRAGNFTGKMTFTTNDVDEKKFDVTVNWAAVGPMATAAPAGPVIDVDSIIDLNNDWVTNAADLVLMLRAINDSDLAGDVNNDDQVDANDVVILLAKFEAH